MNRWFLMMPVFLMLVPVSAWADPNLENADVLAAANSAGNEYFLALEFGKYEYDRKESPTPIVKSAFLDINGMAIELENLRAKIMGNSFVLHSEDVAIYAKGLGDDQYMINTYILDGTGFNRISLFTVDDVLPEKISDVDDTVQNLVILTQQDERNYWKDVYDIAVRVFDGDVNTKPEFHQSFGAVEGAHVNVLITNDGSGEIFADLSGHTNDKGIWEGEHIVTENITVGGIYSVDVSASYMGIQETLMLDMVVITDTRNSDGGSS